MEIQLTRASLCMGDDCNAPHASTIECNANSKLTDVLLLLAGYLPSLRNATWEVICAHNVIGRCVYDENAKHTWEVSDVNLKASDLPQAEFHCRAVYNKQ